MVVSSVAYYCLSDGACTVEDSAGGSDMITRE